MGMGTVRFDESAASQKQIPKAVHLDLERPADLNKLTDPEAFLGIILSSANLLGFADSTKMAGK
jgi:hypothetical protein